MPKWNTTGKPIDLALKQIYGTKKNISERLGISKEKVSAIFKDYDLLNLHLPTIKQHANEMRVPLNVEHIRRLIKVYRK